MRDTSVLVLPTLFLYRSGGEGWVPYNSSVWHDKTQYASDGPALYALYSDGTT